MRSTFRAGGVFSGHGRGRPCHVARTFLSVGLTRISNKRLEGKPLHLNPPLGNPSHPSLKLPLTLKTALTIAKAMKPTITNTASSTTVAMTFTNRLSWLEMMRW